MSDVLVYRVSLTLFKAVYSLLYFIPLRCEILCVLLVRVVLVYFSFIDNSVFLCSWIVQVWFIVDSKGTEKSGRHNFEFFLQKF